MLGAERLLADRQRALIEWPRPHKITEVFQQKGKVVEARCRIGMLGTERLLADHQRALQERPRLHIGSAAMKITARTTQEIRTLCIRRISHFRADRKEMRCEQPASWP